MAAVAEPIAQGRMLMLLTLAVAVPLIVAPPPIKPLIRLVAVVTMISPRWVESGVSRFEPMTTRVELLLRVRLARVRIGLVSAAVALERRVLLPPAKVTAPTRSLRKESGKTEARSVVVDRPTVVTVALGAVFTRVIVEPSLTRLARLPVCWSICRPPPLLIVMLPTLVRLPTALPVARPVPSASATWALLIVSVPVKGLVALWRVSVLPLVPGRRP